MIYVVNLSHKPITYLERLYSIISYYKSNMSLLSIDELVSSIEMDEDNSVLNNETHSKIRNDKIEEVEREISVGSAFYLNTLIFF